MPTIYIIRGLPGSGKSTLARKLVHESRHREADMFFINNGEYRYDPKKTKDAHAWCRSEMIELMLASNDDACVSNTFTQKWEYQPYIDLAGDMDYSVQIIDMHGEWGNVHNVPTDVIENMRARWEPVVPNIPINRKLKRQTKRTRDELRAKGI